MRVRGIKFRQTPGRVDLERNEKGTFGVPFVLV